ncbi:hypothetical protein [Cellulomonas fengjieae]|uniref:Uncharacterized protein n=1 Tax=Cellulomonas fengjieae TaxID=2819978 RepID=A0ABS3SJ64_9CELL|nr:hypothetical protein [Cellulomonas fengjieae]MBO3085795.1 hypothetical protein [Cellulomonas fengjieae]MBO3102905.1 hypothetical protein [Cellulomonas fengjieae]QVI67501.1 hypothetical protein KG102_08065 [Cellulomonas fengjieae]
MDLRIDVTDADIRAARRLWEAAADGGATADRVQLLRAGYIRLISAQAQQIADDFRREQRAS